MAIRYHNGRQMVCWCSAYSFPHRFGGGRCNGNQLASEVWQNRTHCRDCLCRSDAGCDVINGTEHARECPGVADFVTEWELKL